MSATITTICLTAYALGFANAEEVCRNSDTVVELSEQYNIKPEIIVSLVYHESRWNPQTRSRAGACGLTQVISRWTRNPKLSCKQLKDDPALSLRTGVSMLYSLLNTRRYANGNMKVALCMYNAGPKNCRFGGVKWRGNSYARKVLKTSKKFRDKMLTFDPEAEDEVF
jgi:soluble lytic murein transglycosylase-like protein